MISILKKLTEIWSSVDYPFLIYKGNELRFNDIASHPLLSLSDVRKGDVVALIGDFNPSTINTFLRLIDAGVVVVPLTVETSQEHEYFFEQALVDVVIHGMEVRRRSHNSKNDLLEVLKKQEHSGLILFSTGTTGKPKAILHDLTKFLKRFETPRPALRTINFLLFDHIGGINTLLHSLFNKGCVVAPEVRSVNAILEACQKYGVELLPTTPTFLRMMLMSGSVPHQCPASLKVITYGTERMDQPTLDELCALLPNVDFRQTFGMSELGIVRVKSECRNSLYMKLGGEGVETRVMNGVLQIRSSSRMLGYLNAPSPFDADGWYDTKDVVEVKDEYYKVIGRISDVVNVGGLKFMASEVERVALEYPDIELVKVITKSNPITGQHVELLVQTRREVSVLKEDFLRFLQSKLQSHMVPRRLIFKDVAVGHRFKKL